MHTASEEVRPRPSPSAPPPSASEAATYREPTSLLGRIALLEREDFTPTYEDDNAVDPRNLPENILAIYNTLVDSNLQVVDPNAAD